MSIVEIAPVKLWREWYVRVVEDSVPAGQKGHLTHWGPWLTETVATYLVRVLRERFKYEGKI